MMYTHKIEHNLYAREGPNGYQDLRERGGMELRSYIFRNLSEDGYKTLITDYVTWAMPKAQRLSEKISTLVDQRTFTDIMKIVQRPIEVQR